MGNIKLYEELKESKLKNLKLKIRCKNIEIEKIGIILENERNKKEIEDLLNNQRMLEEEILEIKKELEQVRNISAIEYTESCIKDNIEKCKKNIEKYTAEINRTKMKNCFLREANSEIWEDIHDSIDKGILKAPKSEKKREEFIEDLLEKPEYQDKIMSKANELSDNYKSKCEKKLQNEKIKLSLFNASSTQTISILIDCLNYNNIRCKAEICEWDIVDMFNNINAKKNIIDSMGAKKNNYLMNMLAQVPYSVYKNKIKPQIEESLEDVWREYNITKLHEKAKRSIGDLKKMGGLVLSSMTGAVVGAIVAESVSQGVDPSLIGFVGGSVGLAGGAILGKKTTKNMANTRKNHREIFIDDFIEREVRNVLANSGYYNPSIEEKMKRYRSSDVGSYKI